MPRRFLHIMLVLLLLSACGSREARRMRQLLLLTSEQNQNDTVFRSDSVQRILVDYYDRHGSANERMLAHYLLGRAYQDMHEAPLALECFQRAVDVADTLRAECDYALLSRVYGQISDIFYQQNLMEEDLRYNATSIHYAWKARDTLCAIRGILGNIAPYERLGKPDSALSACLSAAELSRRIGQEEFAAAILGGGISLLIDMDSISRAKELMDIYEERSGYFDVDHNIEQGRETYYNPKGRYYMATGQYDSAEYYFRKELREGRDFNNQNGASRCLALLFQKTHQPDSAAKYALYSYAMNDSVYAHMATSDMEKMRSMYDYTRNQELAQQADKRSERLRYKLIAGTFLMLTVILATLGIILWEHRRRKEALQNYENSIAELAQAQSELFTLRSQEEKLADALTQAHTDISELSKHTANLRLMIENKENTIERLQKEVQNHPNQDSHLHPIDEKRLKESDIYRRFDKMATRGGLPTAADWQQMYMVVISVYPGFYQFLSSKKHTLNEKEFNTCILVRAHFRPKDICNLLGVSSAYITKIRCGMMKKLFGMEGTSKELDERLLQMS